MKKLSWLSKMRPMEILIRLREHSCCPESSLDAQFRRRCGSYYYIKHYASLIMFFLLFWKIFTFTLISILKTLRKHTYSNILKILPPKNEGGSNEYPQSMFFSRNNKNNVYPCKPQFYNIKVGFKGVKII